MADFTIDVPINLKGGTGPTGSVSGGRGAVSEAVLRAQEKTNKLLKKLDKSIIATFDPIEILTSAFKDLIKLFRPLIQVLGLLFVLAFLPLLPALMKLTKTLADFASKMASSGFLGALKGTTEESLSGKSIATKVLAAIGVAILAGVGLFLIALAAPALAATAAFAAALIIIGTAVLLSWELLKSLFGIIVQAFKDFWESIKDAFSITVEFFKNLGSDIWNFIKSGLSFISDLGVKIWNFILSGLSFISDFGLKIWNFIKSSLSTIGSLLVNGFKAIINGAIRLANKFLPGFAEIPELANGGIVTKPTLALIGESGPEAIVPLSKMGQMGNVTINIIKPTLRNESDIKALANEVSRVMQRSTKGRFSQ